MAKMEVRLQQKENMILYGVWGKASDQTLSKDIPLLSSAFYIITRTQEGMVLPFFVLSRNYNASTGDSELFIGSLLSNDGLSELALPNAMYAVITVKPKFGVLWWLAVGEAKRFFYTKWLPQSNYCGENMEYEYHSEKTKGKNPTVDIVFAIKERT